MEINKTILMFGEILLRFFTPSHEKLTQTKTLGLNIGGGANVTVPLDLLNHK
ncbi:hypothetical protein [Flavivirga spongiicola]|uniref:Uncharacterized protein n=1 Tax=Flavivirga spongiicola TaxID=421621 RepID=A0ABU7XRP3_9FLAO|nr:hypothetical protein [Flavivirga sp. MEBiC05379]MDO5978093.1 hypothetical protein [Flavivirga sp. MEBiC05379]